MLDQAVGGKVKAFIVGDVHANAPRFERVLRLAAHAEAFTVIQVGDFGYWPRSNAGRRFLESVSASAKRLHITVHWVDGNHEEHDLLNHAGTEPVVIESNLIWHPRGTTSMIGESKILWLGGAVSVDKQYRTPNIDWFANEAPSIHELERAALVGKVDVVISHEAPSVVPLTGNFPGFIPPDVLRAASNLRADFTDIWRIVQPELWFHGHWHHRQDTDIDGTRFVSLGSDHGPVEKLYVSQEL